MKPRWALLLPSEGEKLLRPLRLWHGVEVCALGESVWLRGVELGDEWEQRCRCLPGAERFTVFDDGQLLSVGSLVPLGYLPQEGWQPLSTWLRLALPPVREAGRISCRIALHLVRSTATREPSWLLTSLEAWAAYAVTAPQVRLARWNFVVAQSSRALVRGAPLPPLPGRRFVDHAGVAVPAGWTWTPAVDVHVVRQTLGLAVGECALWIEDGSWTTIGAGDWVAANRSAARLTLQEQRHGGA